MAGSVVILKLNIGAVDIKSYIGIQIQQLLLEGD